MQPFTGDVSLGTSLIFNVTGTQSNVTSVANNLNLVTTGNGKSVVITASASSGTARTMITANGSTEAVTLFHASNQKLATTSSGISVTGDLTVSGGDITLGGTGRIQGVDTVTLGTDAANKTYVDNAVGGSGGPFLPLAGGTMTGNTTNTAGTEVRFGSSNEFGLFFSSGVSNIRVNSGYLAIRADDMRFMNQDTTEKMRITSSGNVGIGVTNPSTKLQVAGTSRFDGNTDIFGNLNVANNTLSITAAGS